MRQSMTPCVATFVCSPDAPVLTDALLTKLSGIMSTPETLVWLCPGIAADIASTAPADRAGDLLRLREGIEQAIESLGVPVDVVVQRSTNRRKRLLVADMDSTMIGQECIDELADYAGFKERVAAITERAMRGEIAFEPALRERVALLRGLPAAVIDKVITERIRPMPGGATLVATMRANGAYTCVVSGGFTAFTERIAAMIGFDEQRANALRVDGDGRLTGEVVEPVLGRDAKRDTLIALRERLRLEAEDTLAVGDGANDIPMIKAAGIGVAFRGKPALKDAADARIDHGDLTALLYAQGYRRDEFVEVIGK